MGRTQRIALPLIAAVLGTACISVAGLSGGTEDGAAADASSQTADATPPIDPMAPDADASAPDVDAPDGAGLCADAALCDDFDAVSLDARWDVLQIGTGSVTRGAPAQSGPNALVISSATGANSDQAAIRRSLFGAFKKITCSFDYHLDVMPSGGFEIAHFDVESGGNLSLLTLGSDAIQTALDTKYFTSVPVGAWARYLLVIDLVASTASVSKSGGPVTTIPLTNFPIPEKTLFSFGVRYLPGGPLKYRIDDLVCRTEL